MKAELGVLLFILITVLLLSRFISAFVDLISSLYVLGGALSFALCAGGAWNSKERLEAASEGAVICGWLGALIGAIAIASKLFPDGESRACHCGYALDDHARVFFEGSYQLGFTFKEWPLRCRNSDWRSMLPLWLGNRATCRNGCFIDVMYSGYMRRPF